MNPCCMSPVAGFERRRIAYEFLELRAGHVSVRIPTVTQVKITFANSAGDREPRRSNARLPQAVYLDTDNLLTEREP